MGATTAYYFVETSGAVAMEFDSDDSPINMGRQRALPITELLGVKAEPCRAKLARAIERAVAEHTRSVLMVGDAFDTRRMITVRPAREADRAVVTCVELDAGVSALQVGDVIELFSVSPAEAEIAIHLTRGASLADVAERRGVQLETVRGQVKTLLRKVGVANQKQLAAIMAQVGAALLDVPAGLATRA